jgi:fructose-1,6-bisphosphatase-3
MAGIDELSSKFLKLEDQLNSNIPATLWISDLHGEGTRFKSILRGRFGVLYQTCKEALPKTFGADKVQYLVRIIRKKCYITDSKIKMDRQDVILCLVEILKYKFNNIQYKLKQYYRPEFRDVIDRLLTDRPISDAVFEVDIISNRLITHLSHTIRQVLLDRIIVLGDIFDRGSEPDKIIRILSSKSYLGMVDYVLGNHDILWMGAATGNRSLIAEALRITCRYDHFSLLDRLQFDSSKLAKFARKTYPAKKITGRFKANTDLGRSMEKALAIIQFKLEEETIKKHPEYEMDSRLWLDKLVAILASEDCSRLNDTHFPTVDPVNPTELTKEEAEVIDDLEQQFLTNRRLKRLLKFFFQRGETYYIHNRALNIHALVPSTGAGEFDEFLGRKGRDLLDFIQSTIKKAGKKYLAEEKQEEKGQALFFYLWCGPKSPFFGKQAMKTFERYFLVDKETHKEPSLYWEQNLKSDQFKNRLMKEFGTKRVIFGHTPVNYKKGAKMASDDGVAINIDGGFAEAYYNRGHALVHTPHQLYGIILPTPEEMKIAATNLESAPLTIQVVDEFHEPMKIRDTAKGKILKKKRDRILAQILKYKQHHLS